MSDYSVLFKIDIQTKPPSDLMWVWELTMPEDFVIYFNHEWKCLDDGDVQESMIDKDYEWLWHEAEDVDTVRATKLFYMVKPRFLTDLVNGSSVGDGLAWEVSDNGYGWDWFDNDAQMKLGAYIQKHILNPYKFASLICVMDYETIGCGRDDDTCEFVVRGFRELNLKGDTP